jgi:hypothetical protein
MTCDQFRGIVVGTGTGLPGGQPDLARHAAGCTDCRRWLAAYETGLSEWDRDAMCLADGVLARTGHAACERARLAIVSEADEPLDVNDTILVRQHLNRCEECSEFERVWRAASAEMPALAEWDPGPWFAAAVLAHTSGRAPALSGLDRLRTIWSRLVRRPRLAWEVAYACTLCWMLFVGQPLAAYDWTTARVGEMARTAVPARVQTAQARVQVFRELVAGDVSQVAGRIADRRETARGVVRGTIRDIQDWAVGRLTDAMHTITESWRAIAAWVEALFAAPGAATEAGAGPRNEPRVRPAR